MFYDSVFCILSYYLITNLLIIKLLYIFYYFKQLVLENEVRLRFEAIILERIQSIKKIHYSIS